MAVENFIRDDKRTEQQKVHESFLRTILAQIDEVTARLDFYKRNGFGGFIPRYYLTIFNRKKKRDLAELLQSEKLIIDQIKESFEIVKKGIKK